MRLTLGLACCCRNFIHRHPDAHIKTHTWLQATEKTFIVGFKQHFVFAQHRLAVKYDNTDPSDTEKKNLHYHSLKYCQQQMAFNTFGLNKKKEKIKSRLGTHVQFYSPSFGRFLSLSHRTRCPARGPRETVDC